MEPEYFFRLLLPLSYPLPKNPSCLPLLSFIIGSVMMYHAVELKGEGVSSLPLKSDCCSRCSSSTGENETLQPQVLCNTSHLLAPVCIAWFPPPYKQNQVSSDTHFLVPCVEAVLYRADIRDSVVFQSSLHQLYWFSHYSLLL